MKNGYNFQQTIKNNNLTIMATYKNLSKDWRKEVASFEDCISLWLGVDRYVFFRADTDTDYYRSSRPITDI